MNSDKTDPSFSMLDGKIQSGGTPSTGEMHLAHHDGMTMWQTGCPILESGNCLKILRGR